MGSLYAKDPVDLAISEIGYQATGSNKKTCKYSADLDAINYWNMGAKNGVADFCSIFVSWLAYKSTRNANGNVEPDKWDAHYFLFQPDKGENLGAGCGYQADYYMQHDAWTDNPERGDQVFFRNFAHTGIVVDWDNEGFFTVEANVNGGKVAKRYYKYGDSSVDGFGRPRYDGWEYPTSKKEEPKKEEAKKPTSNLYKVNVGDYLAIRTGAGTDNAKVGELYDGATVEVYEIKDGWGRINSGLWVIMDYLE